MWAKLVTLDTIHWYCEDPEPTAATHRHDSQVRQCKSVAHYLFFFLIHSSLPNSLFSSIFMQKWKMEGGGLTSSNRLLCR